MIFRPSESQLCGASQWNVHCVGEPDVGDQLTFGDLLQAHATSLSDIYCVRQPAPICELVTKEAWSELLVLASCIVPMRDALTGGRSISTHTLRWDVIVPGFPEVEWAREHVKLARSQELLYAAESPFVVDEPIAPGIFDWLVARIRQWAPCVLREAEQLDQDRRQAEARDLSRFVHLFTHWQTQISGAGSQNTLLSKVRGRQCKYSAVAVLSVCRAARSLRQNVSMFQFQKSPPQ